MFMSLIFLGVVVVCCCCCFVVFFCLFVSLTPFILLISLYTLDLPPSSILLFYISH